MRLFSITRVSRLQPMLLWLTVSFFAALLLALYEYRSGLSDLSDRMRSVETLLAERLAQHDAHLSGLGAVIRMSPQDPSPSIQGLAENIIARYPRITGIATINTDDQTARVFAYGYARGPSPATEQPTSNLPVLHNIGDTTVRPSAIEHAYEIFKLVAPGRILRLRIDANALLSIDHQDTQYSAALALGDTLLVASPFASDPLMTASTSSLSLNHSQPLNLSVSRGFSLGELVPLQLLLPLLAILAVLTWLLAKYREASRERQRQERRAILLQQEARLAHAGRVNAMGEMASGIAHELAQPIAAMLSQSQAARRALLIDRPDIVEKAIDANIRDAKRACDILARMRAYISGAEARLENVSLSEAVTDALHLVEADISQRGITMAVNLSDETDRVRIDIISFQQVIHNLIRNAADAVAGRAAPRIALDTCRSDNQIMITIADNGAGIDATSLDRIFDPFFTTKPDGMGLGLPLSSRLIEKMDGSIEACNDNGARFTIRLPSAGIS